MKRLLLCLGLATSLLAAPTFEEGLIFRLDFRHGSVARLADGLGYDFAAEPADLEPGRVGRAWRCEPAYENLLAPALAAPAAGFVAGDGVRLTYVPAGWGGAPAVGAAGTPGLLWQTTPTVLENVHNLHRGFKYFLVSVYLRADTAGLTVNLALRDTAAGEFETSEEAPPRPTETEESRTVLTGQWQRVTAGIAVDTRRPVQQLVVELTLLEGAGEVQASALQLEQLRRHPGMKTHAGPWIPGGETRAARVLSMPLARLPFSGEAGTIAVWFRLPETDGGRREAYLVSAGGAWWRPVWELKEGTCYAGNPGGEGYKGSGVLTWRGDFDDHDWHHVAVTWEAAGCVVYLDGQPRGRADYPTIMPDPTARLLLGGSTMSHAAGGAVLDEVAIWSRCLDAAAIEALAGGADPAAGPAMPLAATAQSIFSRGQDVATVPLRVLSGAAPAPAALRVRCPELGIDTDAAGGVEVRPWQAEPGNYRLAVSSADGKVDAVLPVEIVPTLPRAEFQIVAWGGGERAAPYAFTTEMTDVPGLREILRRGRLAKLRIDIRQYHPLDPGRYPANLAPARRVGREGSGYPHVAMTLVNTEVGIGEFPEGQWFLDWLRDGTGLTAIPEAVRRGPLRLVGEAPAVVPADDPALRFARWLEGPGKGWPRLNREIVETMRASGLRDTLYYTDQPRKTADLEGLGMGDYWGYPHVPAGLVAEFNRAANVTRLAGVELMLTPGAIFWDPWPFRVDGKIVCLPADMMRQYLWIAVANPADHVGVYGLGEIAKGGLGATASAAALGDTLPEIRRLGMLVGGLPRAPLRVAYLHTDGQLYAGPRDTPWSEWWFNRMATRALAEARLEFDWIGDEHVAAGWLERYDVVLMPGAWVVPEDTLEALTAAAERGCRVVVDARCRATIPGAEVIESGAENGRGAGTDGVAPLRAWARSIRTAFPALIRVRDGDDAWVYSREDGAARFVFVINDRFGPGELAAHELSANVGTRVGAPNDRGEPQAVELILPAGGALYDARGGRELSVPDGHLPLHLGPGDAAIVALVPDRIAALAATAPACLAAGSEAMVEIRVTGASGKAITHRDTVEIAATDAAGRPVDLPSLWRVTGGTLAIPLRLPYTMLPGPLTLDLREGLAGLTRRVVIAVETPPPEPPRTP